MCFGFSGIGQPEQLDFQGLKPLARLGFCCGRGFRGRRLLELLAEDTFLLKFPDFRLGVKTVVFEIGVHGLLLAEFVLYC